jgi:hypothetical protein
MKNSAATRGYITSTGQYRCKFSFVLPDCGTGSVCHLVDVI